MTLHHKSDEEALINFNFLIVKGKMTFKQFIIFIIILFVGISIASITAFASLGINSKFFSYQKEPLKIETNDIKIKSVRK